MMSVMRGISLMSEALYAQPLVVPQLPHL